MSKLKDEVDLLRSIPMLAKLPSNKLKLLAFASDRVSFAKGEVLFEQNDEADAGYIIISGQGDVLVSTGPDTPPAKVASIKPHEFVGDMAILCDIPRTATVAAATDLEALKIRKEHMMELINETPSLAVSVLKEQVQRLAKTTRDLSEARAEIARLKA